MSEEQIERRVERRVDALDARFMAGLLSQSEYDAEMARIHKWASEAYLNEARLKHGIPS